MRPALRLGADPFPRGPGLASLIGFAVRARRTVFFVRKRPVAGDAAPKGGVVSSHRRNAEFVIGVIPPPGEYPLIASNRIEAAGGSSLEGDAPP
jgi:hypothetical protein